MLGAPRHLLRALQRLVRGARLASPLLIAGAAAASSQSCVAGDGGHIRKVCLEQISGWPRYGHDVLGATPEWHQLTVYWGTQGQAMSSERGAISAYSLPDHVFEDIAPRLVDLNGDGLLDIVTVQSGFSQGARLLAITTGEALKVSPTPYIGQRNRWLAPLGAADLDGDGAIEIAYVDRPHLAKTLRIWRYTDQGLQQLASHPGVTNHRIGWDYIIGGIRTCGDQPEMIVASANWRELHALRFDGVVHTRVLGPHSNGRLERAMRCQ
ncbi:MAG: VCBS repeat-containing protein [Pelagimonas sp.]|jgi:hypothetical protein|nr:VCBS repeat-containing protein [Pelagimonas sp.]